ncbi:YHS domain-containing (seleno)protein [Methylobacterium gregans]|uniref:YHS domain-containing protein n=1 Tax=Methylobacterium gregans TaxID=374424 RepID=A0AA37HSK5_9HYPH|nr:YHS domain-containing (seleno)protein [Methylobacterium gregans]MDQ0522659.1 hypothetical protein [Methylobacterium gregans]GJD81342.1 hypothetical protein NBEOAGPD_4588 [Methylobacterium gregans]GLS56837.1 hypothetical protein GCM10007886_50230 [Methylobacterium gregans]
MGPTRRELWLLTLLPLGPACAPGVAGSPAEDPAAILALRGYDAVSYFLPGGPRAGDARFELSWGGRAWRFASAGNRAAFAAGPEAYAPRLDGHDPVGVLDGRLVDTDPLVFALLGGRLYLFRDAERRARLIADPGLADRAEARWPDLARLIEPLPRSLPRSLP